MALCFIIDDEVAFGRMIRNVARMHELPDASVEELAAAVLTGYGVPFTMGRLDQGDTRQVLALISLSVADLRAIA